MIINKKQDNNWSKRGASSTLILAFSAFFLMGVLLSFAICYFVVLRNFPKNVSQKKDNNSGISQFKTDTNETIAIDKIPIDPKILLHPMVYEWRGSVKGKMVSKDENSFTLQDEKGNTFIVTNKMSSGAIFDTLFHVFSTDKKTTKIVKLKDIPVGAELTGDFWVFNNGKDIPVGGSFIVSNKE